MTDTDHSFGTGTLRARVATKGAELQALDADGRALLWDAGAAWPRHSPVLFPIVGKLPEGGLPLGKGRVQMGQHGFARDLPFTWLARSDRGCTLELRDDERTRAAFPQGFALTIDYEIADDTLHVRYTLRNPDAEAVLHASVGAHPAFAWPQVAGTGRDGHRLVFETTTEAGLLHRLVGGGFMSAQGAPSPIDGNTLELADALFEADALILPDLRSRSVRFEGADGQGLVFAWENFPHFGIWTKPGAGFVCLEPWQGYATPEGFAGDFSEKPGVLHLAPGKQWQAAWSVKAR